jgi:hypothetical protein
MNTRSLVFPMTAGDVVQSAEIVSIRRTGSGPEVELLEVVDVELVEGTLLRIHVKSPYGGETWTLELDAATPILLTGISRR